MIPNGQMVRLLWCTALERRDKEDFTSGTGLLRLRLAMTSSSVGFLQLTVLPSKWLVRKTLFLEKESKSEKLLIFTC